MGGRKANLPIVEDIAGHFPDLEILEPLGAGGMGAVFKARQTQLDRTVALKILSSELASDPAFVERFNREAKMLARLSHPNIVAVFVTGTAGPYCYLLMEYVDGVNLRQAMQAGGFTPAETLALVQEICSALKYAHEEGILHRDIKPENILIDSKGRVKIADFGIAKLLGDTEVSDVTLTLQGSILGSPHYMAPEQFEKPGDVDQRADIYSLGVVLYEMLTGELPIGRFALPSEKVAMDSRIDEIVLRTLAKEREQRYQTVNEMKTGFDRIDYPSAPSQAAFINQQLPLIAKYTFRIAMILLAILVFDIILAEGSDELLDVNHHVTYLAGAAILLSSVSAIIRAIHASRTRDDRPGFQPESGLLAIPRDQRTRHMGLTAAILTGISLPFAAITLYLANTVRDSELLKIVVISAFGFDGVLAVLGFLLGAKALGEIRRSGGTEKGLGAPVFAVVTWPVLLLGALGSFFLTMQQPTRAGHEPVSEEIALLGFGVFVILSAFVLVRGLRRWVRGVTDKNGDKRFPGLVLPMVSATILVIVGVLAVEFFAYILPMSNRSDISNITYEKMEEQARQELVLLSSESPQGFSAEKTIPWVNGFPEALITVDVKYATRADFRLVLDSGIGGAPQFTPVGTLLGINPPSVVLATEFRNIRSRIEIGTSMTEGKHGISGRLDFTGQGGTIALESAPNEWVFAPERNVLELSNPEKILFIIATRKVRGENGEEITETLKLEVNVTKR